MSVVIKGKISKRKKKAMEFGAENIDSTAPVEKIIDELQIKNYKAFTFYCQTLRQRRTTKENNRAYHYTVSGHPINAFSNEWDGDLNTGYFEPFAYKCVKPKIISKMHNVEKSDPVTSLMKVKYDWSRQCRNLRLTAAIGNLMQKYESLNEDVVQCPKHIVEMAMHLDSDVDPYFSSSYNWYYAGNGNMQLICVDWMDYLLHSEFCTLYLTQFSKNDMSINLLNSSTFECEGCNILETICSSQNIVALRTKHKVFILKIVTVNCQLTFDKIKTTESELPFTSISFDNHHKNILYITTLDNKLTIVNLDRMKARNVQLKCKINSLVDNWSTVLSSERGSYIHVARNCITAYDKRTNNPVLTWSGVRDVTDDVGCNDITVAKQLEGSTSLYFGTDHHVFLLDVRSNNECKPKVVQRWTHGMQCVPTFMTLCNFEFNKEIISLSSQWCEDTCVITNYIETSRKTEISGVTMPYRPPSILNTLKDAQEKMLCYDLYNPIDNRLCTAVTGNVIFEHGENYIILMQNSLGDISCHTLYPEHMEPFIVDDSIDLLHEWSKDFQLERRSFEVSSIKNFSNVWKKLKNVPSSHRLGGGKLMSLDRSKFSEKDIYKAFEDEELDSGLLDVWVKDDATGEESSFALNLHYSDSD